MAKKIKKQTEKTEATLNDQATMGKTCRGLFVVGTDTNVGKTYIAALIAASLAQSGKRVGVYKPVASGCRREGTKIIADDAVQLWEAAGKPGKLTDVCPQRFLSPQAPHLAAQAEGKSIQANKLRSGLRKWTAAYDYVIVEGAGGWMSPVGADEYVADLALELGFPLVVVAANRLGTINQTLQTLIAISTFADDLAIAGVVLNDILPPTDTDASTATNLAELQQRCVPPVLSHVRHHTQKFTPQINWAKFMSEAKRS